jgi:parallel beta-helix repeat protein
MKRPSFAIAVLFLAACGGGQSLNGVSPAARTTAPAASPASFAVSVTSLNDSGAGTLRGAILAVNAALPGSSSVITFAVNGTITLASNLPAIANRVSIDATTAPTYAGTGPVVALNANRFGGLVFGSGSAGSQLLGMAVDNATGNGVTLNAGSITMNLDYIGLNLAGAAAGNSTDGVYVASTSSNNLIGLNPTNASGVVGNVISGNGGNGLSLHGSSGNTVVANRIGTNPAGSAAIPNGANGIWITAGSQTNEIGGTVFIDSATGNTNNPTGNKGTVPPVFVVPPLGNLVSGNGGTGILIDTASINNVLNGNFVGTTASGDAPIGNGADGVWINGANGNSLIGCQFVNNPFVYYNVLDGNGGNGLHITSSNGVTVQANFFGTGADNTTMVANAGDGILIDGSSQTTQVGGVIPLGNVSAGNKLNGIEVAGTVSGFTTFNTFGGLLAFKGAMPNGNDGLLITSTGGNQTVRTNVFSGNTNNGIELAGNASGVLVEPNVVGLNTVGNALLPNGNDGLLITGTANNNIIGGYDSSVIPQNTFSGNTAYGIAVMGAAHDNQIFNNYVGTSTTGVVALGNQQGGILIGGSAISTRIGGVTTDPTKPQLNLVSGNGGPGITLGPGSSLTQVINNQIGLDRFGLALLPNMGLPIVVQPGSASNTISGNVTALP